MYGSNYTGALSMNVLGPIVAGVDLPNYLEH